MDDLDLETVPCFCPHCWRPFRDKPGPSGWEPVTEGRRVRACLACAVQKLYDRRGRGTTKKE